MAEQSVSEWMNAVEKELGLEGAIASDQGLDPIDDLGGQVEQHIGAAAVRRTAFLVGVAAGRAEQPAVAAQDFAQKLSAMAQGWHSEHERGVPANEQSNRG